MRDTADLTLSDRRGLIAIVLVQLQWRIQGYAGYAAAYPIDWTGGIFVTFNFCPIV